MLHGWAKLLCFLAAPQVHTATIQAEILQLLRALLAAYLPRPQGGALARATLSNTLKLGPDVIASFETQFSTVGAEKDKRNLIKTLVAQAGDDEVGEERWKAVGAGCGVTLRAVGEG